MRTLWLVILGLVILFLVRVYQIGGLSKPEPDPFLTDLASAFIPARQFLSSQINQITPFPQSTLLSGILLGVQSNLPQGLKIALKNSSTIHIVVVSGQNLTLVAGFVMSLTFLLGRKKTVVSALLVIILYALLTGLQLPVLRAALMVGLGFLAQLLGKERTAWWTLLLTAAVMLIYNPNWLLSISFQLFFLATVGVIVVAPILMGYFKFLPEVFKQDLVVSLSAQLLTWPIIAANFHQLSVFGVLVNSLILWIVSPVMISGIIVLVVSLVFLPLETIIGLFPTALLTYFIYIVSFFNNLPANVLYVSKVNPVVWVGYYVMVVGGVWMLHKRQTVNDRK